MDMSVTYCHPAMYHPYTSISTATVWAARDIHSIPRFYYKIFHLPKGKTITLCIHILLEMTEWIGSGCLQVGCWLQVKTLRTIKIHIYLHVLVSHI